MKKIEVKIGLATFSFSMEEYKGHNFYALKKWLPSVKGSAPSSQVLSVRIADLEN